MEYGHYKERVHKYFAKIIVFLTLQKVYSSRNERRLFSITLLKLGRITLR